ncbi:uncharacterized protein LOC132820061 isoform X4 [Hemiscyllium ocellatum]|uniref:uncharacterized protein LOC132820061 isoform X4 n=1 Tax=Hemiscyllium ocellatum TaxID=170820 RepID=UPI0029674784|nr:uncharacterized protein LOC132820061 isoform X4 [Hemiscyllium ocellatum]
MCRRGSRRRVWCLLLCCAFVSLVCLHFSLNEVSISTLPGHAFKDNSVIYKPSLSRVSSGANSIQYDDTCPVFRLHSDEERPWEEVACRRMDFVPGSCRIMKELFADKETANCSHQLSHMICEMKVFEENYKHIIFDYDQSEIQHCRSTMSHINTFLQPARSKNVAYSSDNFTFQNPWNMVMITKALKGAKKAKMEESKFLNEIKFFNSCMLRHVESVEKPRISLEAVEMERTINALRLGKIFEMQSNQWIETPPVPREGTLTRHPKRNKTEEN